MASLTSVMFCVILLAMCITSTVSFVQTPSFIRKPHSTMTLSMSSSNDRIISTTTTKVLATMVTSLSLALTPCMPVIAAVGEGDLPDGVMAFSKLQKYQKDWDKLADTVKTRGNEMDDKEKLGIKLFLKQLSNEYYDLELLTRGVLDAEKKEKALAVAKDFRSKVRAIDDSITIGASLDTFQSLYPTTASDLSTFFTLLQDVPDEL